VSRVDLPPWVTKAFEAYPTAEVTTFTPGGKPSTFPLSGGWIPERGVFLFTTSVAFAKKARNARRDPRAAILFSCPEGSGLNPAPVVLVQGDATVRDDLAANAPEFVRMAGPWAEQQKSFAMIWNSRAWRWWCRYYLVRIFLEVAPRRIRAWRDGDTSKPPFEVSL
jgi:hypothetical protein